MIKRIAILAVSAFLLSGCAASLIQDAKVIELPDGRSVICVFSDGGGTSCDWDRAK